MTLVIASSDALSVEPCTDAASALERCATGEIDLVLAERVPGSACDAGTSRYGRRSPTGIKDQRR